MKQTITVTALTLACLGAAFPSAPLAAQHGQHGQPAEQKKESGPLGGNWTLTVDSPHGSIQMSLALKQDGKAVTGTLTSGMGERPIKGEYADSTLSLRTTDDTSNEWTVSAKLTAAGGLQGHLSASVGDMKFTGEKAKK